ncbi:MAG: GAP family protein, partial [Thermoleophilia bacterium]|nr:GAP family protein [Thermoleophilia bacterium]
AGLTAVGGLTLLIADGSRVADEAGAARWASAIKLLLGVGLLFLAYRSFEKRPPTGEEPAAPAWMNALESYTAARAARLGLLLAAANPKNLLLVVGAMGGVAVAGLPAGQAAGVLAVFVLVSSVGVILPLAYSLLGGEGVRDSLAGWRTWLVTNNAVVVAVVLLVLGVLILFDSLAALIG